METTVEQPNVANETLEKVTLLDEVLEDLVKNDYKSSGVKKFK